ncbi:MAG: putative transposase [Bacteroidia bacterium]|jgi:putative transposase
MPFIKIYVHLVFTTKNSHPFLDTADKRSKVWKHIKENSLKKDVHIDCVNGYSQHCHCLVSLGTNQTIAQVAQLIKGESSFWINKNEMTQEKFSWQTEYWAVSVSESIISKVRRYIWNQEQHHTKKTYEEEIKEFMDKYGEGS